MIARLTAMLTLAVLLAATPGAQEMGVIVRGPGHCPRT